MRAGRLLPLNQNEDGMINGKVVLIICTVTCIEIKE